jgi:hypothetical protein
LLDKISKMKCETDNQSHGNGYVDKGSPRYGIPHEKLCSVKDLEIFRQIGKRMRISVRVIAQDGDEYVTTSINNQGKPNESMSFHSYIVPEGKVYIQITNDQQRMKEFYEKVDLLLEAAKNSKKALRI